MGKIGYYSMRHQTFYTKDGWIEASTAKTVRDSGIKAIVLMDAQIDHTTGLFMLRESSGPLTIHSTKRLGRFVGRKSNL